jgi:hypothetical protein
MFRSRFRPVRCSSPSAVKPRTLASVTVAALAVGALVAACAPPAAPSWVKVVWARDAGGSVDVDEGLYTPSFQQYVTKGGTTTGPTAIADPYIDVVGPFLAGTFLSPRLPDGTARFPWNGYAGEGVSVSRDGVQYTATFPAGSCLLDAGFPGDQLRAAVPSPDGRFIAKVNFFNDFLGPVWATTIRIVALEDGGDCPVLTSAEYVESSDPKSGATLGSQVVWSTNSSAVIVALESASDETSFVRLNASPGATPKFVLGPELGCQVPLGWSVENRLLLSCTTGTVSRLLSVPLGEGTTNVISTFDGTGVLLAGIPTFGYYAPGTNTIVFNKVVTVTNSDGHRVPWSQVHTAYDVPFAPSTPLGGSPPPLVWHQQAMPQPGPSSPPYSFTDVPNQEYVLGWAR